VLQLQPLSGRLHEQLLGMIPSGELAPGTPLRESDLSARLGVGRAPIRVALEEIWVTLKARDAPRSREAMVRHNREACACEVGGRAPTRSG
jgi:DNA-binding GntR family transcriptional regulator